MYKDVDDISKVMLDVVEGREDYHAEIYKHGSMGLLYTNFYKMVTALRESQMKTREEKEFLKETISDISHQLKTPLASLNVFLDLLYEDKITDEGKRKEVLGEAQKQLSRMEWMVLAMLKLARIEAGSVQFEMKMCDVENIIKTAMDGVNYLIDKRGQKIVLEIQGWQQEAALREVKILCDGEWLTEAIINLLKNASDYSGEGTTIAVTLEDHELFTKIHVKDEGVGIPEEALPHIFKRFYRVDNSVNPGSVGIGLALSKSIVEGMNGKIYVKSEVGKFTCFTVTFLK
jgi:signal transduction histidine kinase